MNKHTKSILASLITLALLGSLSIGGLSACSTSSTEDSNNAAESTEGSGGLGSGSGIEQQGQVKIAEGATAPDFTFTTSEGETANLSDYQGKVVLLNFWATWCGYCIDEMPALQKIAENYPDSVVVLAVNRGDSVSEANTFAEESDYDFVWGLDDDGAIQKLYPANGIPYSIIIDKDGVIGTIYEGSAADMYPYFEDAVVAAGA